MFHDRFEQRLQIDTLLVKLAFCDPLLGDAVDRGKVQLRIVRAEREEKLEDLVEDLVRPRVLAVDLVDDDDRFEIQIERLLQDELCSGKRPFGGVHEKQNAVHHRQRPLHLAAEIGVAGRVDDVDLDPLVMHGGVLGQDRDPAFAFEVVRIHDPRDQLLVLAERPRLAQHMVHKRRLAVINVRDNGDVPNVFPALHSILIFSET